MADIYEIKGVDEIPFSLPYGKPAEWYIEAYMYFRKLFLQAGETERAEICKEHILYYERKSENETRAKIERRKR